MTLLKMTHHLGPSGLKKLYKQLGNWKAIPMSLGRLDHKLEELPLQVIVLLLSTVIFWLGLILSHINNIVMTQYGYQ